jgi:hypothetical protein
VLPESREGDREGEKFVGRGRCWTGTHRPPGYFQSSVQAFHLLMSLHKVSPDRRVVLEVLSATLGFALAEQRHSGRCFVFVGAKPARAPKM